MGKGLNCRMVAFLVMLLLTHLAFAEVSEAAENINETVCIFIQLVWLVTGALASIVVIFAGLRWLTSGDDTYARNAAKTTIIAAFTGIIIIFIAVPIVNYTVEGFAGPLYCSMLPGTEDSTDPKEPEKTVLNVKSSETEEEYADLAPLELAQTTSDKETFYVKVANIGGTDATPIEGRVGIFTKDAQLIEACAFSDEDILEKDRDRYYKCVLYEGTPELDEIETIRIEIDPNDKVLETDEEANNIKEIRREGIGVLENEPEEAGGGWDGKPFVILFAPIHYGLTESEIHESQKDYIRLYYSYADQEIYDIPGFVNRDSTEYYQDPALSENEFFQNQAKEIFEYFVSVSPFRECANPYERITYHTLDVEDCRGMCTNIYTNCEGLLRYFYENSEFNGKADKVVGVVKDCCTGCGIGNRDSTFVLTVGNPEYDCVTRITEDGGRSKRVCFTYSTYTDEEGRKVAEAKIWDYRRMAAHEMGHSLGLFHVRAERGVNLCNDGMTGIEECKGPNKADCDLSAEERSRDLMTYCPNTDGYSPAAYTHLKEVFRDYLEDC